MDLQHVRLPCPSPTTGTCSNSCSSSWWCHPTVSSSVIPFSFCLQSFPQHQVFFPPMIQFFASGGQRSVTISSSPSNEYSGLISFRMYWLDSPWESLRDSQESSTTSQFKSINSLALSFLYSPTLTSIHDHWKTIALTRRTFAGKVMSLLFNMLPRLVIAFLSRSKHLLISWLQSPSAVILEPKNKVCHCFHCFPIYLTWSSGTRCHDLCVLNLEF